MGLEAGMTISRSRLMLHLVLVAAAIAPGCGGGGGGGGFLAAGPGFSVTPSAGLVTTEAGGAATFTVVLTAAPTADVTIALSSSNTLEGTVSPASLTFTAAGWAVPQTVTVTGVPDSIVDPNVAYTIVTAAAASADANYSGLNPDDVSVTNTNVDVAAVIATPASGHFTNENGTTSTFNVVLATQPSANVTVALLSSTSTEGTVAPASLVFTSLDWSLAQPVTLTGVRGTVGLVDGPQPWTVTGTPSSADLNYNGLPPITVTATNNDVDAPGVTVTPTAGHRTSEAGGQATFRVALNTIPTAGVTISLLSSSTNEGTVFPASLVFAADATALNFQTATLTGVNDLQPAIDGDIAYTVTVGPPTGAAEYAALGSITVNAVNEDDDVAGVTVTPVSGLVTNEAGSQATFTVALNSVPANAVTIALSSSNTDEGTALPAMLTFNADATALAAQTVTVTGARGTVGLVDGDRPYSIVTAAAASADANYNGLNAADVSATNLDIDQAGIVVTPTSGLVTSESGTSATFQVRLRSIPTAVVTIGLSSSDTNEGTVLPASLVFAADATALNFQTATVTGARGTIGVIDPNTPYTILTAAAVSADGTYSGMNAADVSCVNTDIDNAPPGSSGWVKFGGNPVLSPGAGTWDNSSVGEPSVLKTGPASYLLWYEGVNLTGQKHQQVGRATSLTGTAWAKAPATPVLSHSGINGTFDRQGVGDQSVILDAGTYRMWFAGRAGNSYKIGYATSMDGIAWTKFATNPVLSTTAGAWDSASVLYPHVVPDAGTLKMWYTGIDATGVQRIGYATSPNGTTWTKLAGNPVLPVGAPGAWDAAGVHSPCVILDGATWRMWFVGRNAAGQERIGYAESPNGTTWTKFAGNPVVTLGAAGAFDESQLGAPFVILDAGVFKMWYAGTNAAGTTRIGYATNP